MPNAPDLRDRPQDRDPAPGAKRWPPGRLGGLRDEIDRLFDAFEPRHWFDPPFGALPAVPAPLQPAMDLTETGEAYVLRLEVPGIDADKIAVRLANGTLFVSGKKAEEQVADDADCHVSERRWGSFRRSVRLPPDIDRDRIEARSDKGVLTIHIPKSAAARVAERTIPVTAG